MTDHPIRDALASLADDYELRGERHRTNRHAVYDVTVDGQTAVCKYALEDTDPRPLAREAAVVGLLGDETSVRVPELLGRGDRVAVFSLVEGDSYTDAAPAECRRARLRALGRSLGTLHNVSAGWFDEFGTPTPDAWREGLGLDGERDWGTQWAALVDDWLTRLDDTPDEDVAVRVRETTARARRGGLFDGLDPVLTHADAGPSNVRFAGDEPWLLDWEGAMAFPGEYDLARAHTGFFDRPDAVEAVALRDELVAGYRSVRTLHERSRTRRRLYRATLLAKFVPGGVRAAQEGPIDAAPETFRADLRDTISRLLDAVE